MRAICTLKEQLAHKSNQHYTAIGKYITAISSSNNQHLTAISINDNSLNIISIIITLITRRLLYMLAVHLASIIVLLLTLAVYNTAWQYYNYTYYIILAVHLASLIVLLLTLAVYNTAWQYYNYTYYIILAVHLASIIVLLLMLAVYNTAWQ